MLQQIYHEQKGILVTLNLLTIRDEVYAIAKFDTVALRVEKPDRRDPLVWIFMGILGLLFVVGIIFIGIGIYRWLTQQSIYYVVGLIGNSKTTLYRSVEPTSAKALLADLQRAIAHNRTIAALLKAAQAQTGVLTKAQIIELTGLASPEIDPILDVLVSGQIATLNLDTVTSEPIYDFNEVLSRMVIILETVPKRHRSFTAQEVSAVTAMPLSEVQIALESLVNAGYATPARDVKFGGICYRFSPSSKLHSASC